MDFACLFGSDPGSSAIECQGVRESNANLHLAAPRNAAAQTLIHPLPQVSNNSRAAAVALPVVLLASSRGVALGCKDAIARLLVDPADLLPARIYVFDGARSLLWLLLALLAAVALAAWGVRQVLWRDSVPALHV